MHMGIGLLRAGHFRFPNLSVGAAVLSGNRIPFSRAVEGMGLTPESFAKEYRTTLCSDVFQSRKGS